MNAVNWILSLTIAVLAAVNAVCWGYAIKEVQDPSLTVEFVLRLVFNRFFIMAMASAFTASLLSYVVMSEMGVLAGRYFLSLGAVATILACTLILGERLTPREYAGIALTVAGVVLIGVS